MGDLSAEELCREYDLNVERLFRVRSGEVFEFDDVEIEAIVARHTESKGGNYWNRGYCIMEDGSRKAIEFYGSLEMLNYRITASDGTRIMIWGGMTAGGTNSPDGGLSYKRYRYYACKPKTGPSDVCQTGQGHPA